MLILDNGCVLQVCSISELIDAITEYRDNQ
jgi:hypothetical protein